MTPVEGGLELSALKGASRYIVIAKDQPEYLPLPALVFADGRVCTEWQPTEEERARIAAGENIRLWIWTFGQPVQPISLGVTGEGI